MADRALVEAGFLPGDAVDQGPDPARRHAVGMGRIGRLVIKSRSGVAGRTGRPYREVRPARLRGQFDREQALGIRADILGQGAHEQALLIPLALLSQQPKGLDKPLTIESATLVVGDEQRRSSRRHRDYAAEPLER